MLVYLAKRGIARLTLLIAAGVAIFLLTRPLIAETAASAPLPAIVDAVLARMRALLGIDASIVSQFASWTSSILGGDLGRSAAANASVVDLLRSRAPVTAQLLVGGFVLAFAIALPAGLLAARRRGGPADRGVRGLIFLAEATPLAGLALVVMLVFAILLRWLPPGGHVNLASDPMRALAHLALPASALAVGLLPILLRAIRDGARAGRGERHLITALAFGASARGLAWGRALRLGLVPALAPLATLTGQALSAAVLIEAIFDLPGLGRLAIESVLARDYVLLRGLALASAAAIVAAALASDLLRGLLDSRVRAP